MPMAVAAIGLIIAAFAVGAQAPALRASRGPIVIRYHVVMPCTPNDYMRILGLVDSSVVMHFYFTDGSYVRGYIARAELDPATRRGLLLLVIPEDNRILQCDAGDLLKVSSRAPDGSLH